MANEQTNSNEYITQAAAKAARLAIQTMSAASAAWTKYAGPWISGSIIYQPTSDCSTKDKYAELRTFKLQVKTCSKL